MTKQVAPAYYSPGQAGAEIEVTPAMIEVERLIAEWDRGGDETYRELAARIVVLLQGHKIGPYVAS